MPKITNVLITRPAPKGQVLAKKLHQQGFTTHVQPLFDYQQGASVGEVKQCVTECENAFVIFVSVAAVQFSQASYSIAQWQSKQIFAIGQATKKALENVGIEQIVCPSIQTSEGLLALTQFENVDQQNIIIVRGDGGREYLANALIERNAKVVYLESYQRNWLKQPENTAQQWQAAKINCIVVTSNALLDELIKLTRHDDRRLNDYWQKKCLWLVVSSRIAEQAKAIGLEQVVNTGGASDQAIIQALEQYHLNQII